MPITEKEYNQRRQAGETHAQIVASLEAFDSQVGSGKSVTLTEDSYNKLRGAGYSHNDVLGLLARAETSSLANSYNKSVSRYNQDSSGGWRSQQNAAAYIQSAQREESSLRERAERVRRLMEQYQTDDGTRKSVNKTLDDILSGSAGISDYAKSSFDYWRQFKDDGEYNTRQRQQAEAGKHMNEPGFKEWYDSSKIKDSVDNYDNWQQLKVKEDRDNARDQAKQNREEAYGRLKTLEAEKSELAGYSTDDMAASMYADRIAELNRQIAEAKKTYGTAKEEYDKVFAEYNAARDELKKADRELRTVQTDTTDPNYAAKVKAAEERLARAKEAYIAQGGDPNANVISAGLRGSASGVVGTAGYLQELSRPENAIKLGPITIGGGDDRIPLAQRQAMERDAKAKYEAEHGAGTWKPAYERTQELSDRLAQQSASEIESMKTGKGELGQFAVDLGVQGVQMGADIAAGQILPGGSLTAMALRSFGSGVKEAREAGATLGQQGLYGLGTAAVEVLTEKMFDGLAGIYGGGIADDMVSHAIGKYAKSNVGRAALNFIADAAGEGLEEVVSDLANPLLRSIYDEHVFDDGYFGALDASEIMYDFLVGAAMGAVGGGVSFIKNATGSSTDARTEFFMQAGQDGKSLKQAVNEWKLLQIDSGYSMQTENAEIKDLAEEYRKRLEQGKRVSERKIEQLNQRAVEQITTEDIANTVTAVQTRMQELGQNDPKLAQAIAAVALESEAERVGARNMAATPEQHRLVQGNQTAQRILSEMDVENLRNEQLAGYRAILENRAKGATKEDYDRAVAPYQRSNEWVKTMQQNKVLAADVYGAKTTITEAEKTGKVTFTNKGGHEISGQIVGVKDGKVTIKHGADNKLVQEVDIDQIKGISAGYSTLLKAAAARKNGTAMLRLYNPGQDVNAFIRAWDMAENYYGVTNLTAKEARAAFSLRELTDAQLEIAMDLGREEAKKKGVTEEARQQKVTGEVKFHDGKGTIEGVEYDATSEEEAKKLLGEAEYAFIKDVLAKVVNVTLVKSKEINGQYVGAQGIFFRDGRIYFDVNSGINSSTDLGERTIVLTAAHELTHYIRAYNEKAYDALQKFITEELVSQGKNLEDLIREKQRRSKWTIDADEALEEVIADACETMLTDGEQIRAFASQHEAEARGIYKWLDKFFSKWENAFGRLSARHEEAKAMQGRITELRKMWLDALAGANENAMAAQGANATQVGSIDMADYVKAKGTDGKRLFQVRAFENDESQYREMLTKWGGMSTGEINSLFRTVDSAMSVIKNNLEALDYAWDADIDDRAFQPVKPNSDKLYKVSQDFSTLCRKRILQQLVAGHLQAALNRAITREEGIAIRDALIAIQKEGKQIEVACALCYVESARMRSPKQIQKFLDNREAVIRDFFAGRDAAGTKQRMAEAEAREREAIYEEYGLIHGKGADNTMYDVRDSKTASLKKMPGFIATRIRAAKKAAKAGYAPTAEQQALINAAKEMTVSDFTTPEGLENLAKNYRELFDAYTSYIRNATNSKGIENDTWWRAGDSQKISDLLVEQMNRENGLRTQSWSDFQVKHLMDYIAATIELSTRNAKQHAYTKVIDYVDLMGNTGVMINMSLIPTREFTGKLTYDDVEGFVYKEAMRLRDKYHATAGTICIGVDNQQIALLLASDKIDYVIPYHRSGMAAHIRAAMHIPSWSEYESVQNEQTLNGAEARANAAKYGVELLDPSDENWHVAPKFSDWFDLETAKQEAELIGKSGKYGVMTGGYAAMQNAARRYMEICAERGLAPKFSYGKGDFSTQDNYWKLLIDRKMVDNVTGDIIEQKALKPVFEMDTIQRILNDELARYGRVKEDQNEAIRRVSEAFLGGKIKAGMSSEEIERIMQRPVDNISKVNITQSARDAGIGTKLSASEQEAAHPEGKAKHADRDRTAPYTDYDQPITLADIRSLQSIGRISVNDFSSADIQKTQKWAHKFYQQLGVKSPFFRAWFGDWRAFDTKTRSDVVKVSSSDSGAINYNKRNVKNEDTGFIIPVSSDIIDDTLHYARINGDVKQVMKWLPKIDDIVKNAVLLDTQISEKKGGNKKGSTCFMHYLYAPVTVNGAPFLAKLSVEEYGLDQSRRAYNLQRITMSDLSRAQFENIVQANRGKYAYKSDALTVAQVFDFVKTYDVTKPANKAKAPVHNFNPKPVSPRLLNEDGTPKVLFHQTGADFDVFNTDRPVAGANDSETPNGIFFKTNDHDIGLEGKKQMPVYITAEKLLHFADRKAANAWYQGHIPGYKALQEEMLSKIDPIDQEMNHIEEQMYADGVTDEQYDAFDTQWNDLHEQMRVTENDYRGRLRNLLDDYFIRNDSGYDGIELDYDGHRYIDGKRENVHTFIVFKNTQVKSATDNIGTFDKSDPVIKHSLRDNAAVQKTKEHYNERLDKLRAEKNAKIEQIRKEETARRQAAVKKEKAAKWEKVGETKDYYRDMMQRQRGKRSDTAVRGKIKALHKELTDMLLNPKEGRYVPKDLVKATAEILGAVDTTSKRAVKAKDALARLRVQYDALKEDQKYALSYDETVSGMIQEIAKDLGDESIYELTGSNLEGVYNVLKALKHAIRTANQLVGAEIEATAFEAANQMMDETKNAKSISTKFLRKFVFSQLTPERFGNLLSGYRKNGMWKQMMDMLNRGQMTQTQIMMEGGEIFRELIGDKRHPNKMLKTLHDQKHLVDIGLKDQSGNAVKITRGMMLSVYMHLLNEDNARHVAYGGFTVPRFAQYYKGQMGEAFTGKTGRAVAYNQEAAALAEELETADAARQEEILARLEEIEASRAEDAASYIEELRENIEKELTDYDRKWIEAAQYFFDVYSKEKLNEVTEMVYGFEKAQVDHYFPIHTDQKFRTASFDSIARDFSLENAGFMKKRVYGANPIQLEDITDVVSTQLRKTAQYVGLMPAIRNFNKAYGKARMGYSDSVQDAVSRTFNKQGLDYIENLMADLNGARRTEADIFDEIRGNVAGAALTLSPRVTLAQMASYPTAAAEIGYKPLARALADVAKNPMFNSTAADEIAKWTPLWWYRMQGFRDTELGDIKSNEQWMNQVMNKMTFLTGWIQFADGLTTGGLWQASKYYVEENFKDLEKGSEDYFLKVAETYNRVIERTQPNYTTMQRPDILRNPSKMVKQFTMFLTQRLQNFNLMYDAIATYNTYAADLRNGRNGVTAKDVKTAGTRLAWTLTSQVVASGMIVTFKYLADMLLHSMNAYRDDDDELTEESRRKALLIALAETMTSNALWGSEVFNIFKTITTGDKYYGLSLSSVEAISETLSAITNGGRALVTGDTEKAQKEGVKLGKQIAQVFGIPVNNAMKIVNGFKLHVEDAKNGTLGSFEAGVERSEKQNTHILFDALESGDKDRAAEIRETFDDKKDEQGALKGYVKDLYTGEKTISKGKALEYLQKYAGMTRRSAEDTVQQWSMEVETGRKYSDLQDDYISGEISKNDAVKWFRTYSSYGHTTQAEAEAKVLEWSCEKETGIAYGDIGTEVKTGRLGKERAVAMVMKYGGKEEDAADKQVEGWLIEHEYNIKPTELEEEYMAGRVDVETAYDILMRYQYNGKEDANGKAADALERWNFIGENPGTEDITITQIHRYQNSGLEGVVSGRDFLDAYEATNIMHGVDTDGDGKANRYTRVDQQLAYIDAMALTADQKTALALALGINEKSIRNRAPWSIWRRKK